MLILSCSSFQSMGWLFSVLFKGGYSWECRDVLCVLDCLLARFSWQIMREERALRVEDRLSLVKGE